MNGESMLQKIHLLLHMSGLQSRRHAGTGVPTRIQDVPAVVVLRLIQQCLDPRLSEAPCARIEGLFLTPDNVLSVRVHVKVLFQQSPWERVELLDTGDGCVLELPVRAVLVKGDVNLACAENDTLNLVWIFDRLSMFGVRDDPLEVGVASEIFDR